MHLIDAERAETALRAHGRRRSRPRAAPPATPRPASPRFGGRAAFIGKVADDQLGAHLPPRHARRSASISTRRRSTAATPTARSMILITPDGERTMNTYLGACQALAPADIDAGRWSAARRSPISRAISGIRRRPRRPSARRPRSPTAPAARCRSRSPTPSASTASATSSSSSSARRTVDILFANDSELQLALRDRRLRHGGRRRPPRRQARRGHRRRRRRAGGHAGCGRGGAGACRSRRSSIPPAPATCSPPASSSGSRAACRSRRCAGSAISPRPR